MHSSFLLNSSRRHTLSVSRQRRNKWRLSRGDTTFCVEEGMLQGRHTSSHPRLRLDDKYTEILQTGYKVLDNASF